MRKWFKPAAMKNAARAQRRMVFVIRKRRPLARGKSGAQRAVRIRPMNSPSRRDPVQEDVHPSAQVGAVAVLARLLDGGAAKHGRQDCAREKVGGDSGVQARSRLALRAGEPDALDQCRAHRPENSLQGLLLAGGVPVDFADHRADELQVGDKEGLVALGERLEFRSKAALAPGSSGILPPRVAERIPNNCLDKALLCPELPEQGYLVHSGLLGDRAGGCALKPVAREDTRSGV